MKKDLLSFLLLLTVVVAACAGQKQTVSATEQSSSGNSSITKTDITYMRMQRTPCFGRCPFYQLEVYEDGLVRFTGYRDVKDTGVYEKKIATAAAQEILNTFEQYRVDTLRDGYDMMISDIPGIDYTFTINGKKKEVGNAHFGPVFLKTLAKKADGLVRKKGEPPMLDDSWKRTGSAKFD